MINGPLQSQSMASVSLARGLQSLTIYFCVGTLSDSGVANLSLFLVFHAVVNSARQLHRLLMGCAGNSHLAEADSGSRKHDMRLSRNKYFCIRIALN